METFSVLLAFVRGIHQSPMNFPQRPVTELWCFLWSAPQSSSWANNGDAGDLRRHRTHYDVTVMFCALVCTRSVAWVSNIIHWNWFNHRQHRMQPSQVQKIIMVQPSSWSHVFFAILLLYANFDNAGEAAGHSSDGNIKSICDYHYGGVIMVKICVSNHQPHQCLLNHLVRCKSKKTRKLRVREIHRWPVNFPHKWRVTRKMFPFDDVIMM